jgi:glycosyltransferase involved in cell wall biosynthesis
MEKGLVSVVIPTYKRNDTLTRAIDSAIGQTYKKLEVLVVDDNNEGDEYSKSLRKIISSYDGCDNLRLITQPKHINGAEARNAGIRAAKGEWIAFLDDDDEWFPTKIEKQMNALSAQPDVMGASCYYNEYIDGKLIHSCPPYNTNNLNFKIFSREISMYTPTLLMRKDRILEFGGFDNELKRHQDIQLLVEFTHRNKMLVVEESLVNVYGDSLMNRPSLDTFIQVKRDFFYSVKSIFNSYSPHEQKLIKFAHYYEVAFCAIKVKNYAVALKYLIKAGLCPVAIKMLVKRFRDKKFIA